MREVFRLRLNADLVVLSACQTGLGKRVGSEGTVGLSTAFLTSGTPSLVMSLWNVPDLPTALLMHRFYENLGKGQSKADSLRQAKQWLRNLSTEELDRLVTGDRQLAGLSRGFGAVQQSEKGRKVQPRPFVHPHYWAGFVLSGSRL
jgi:CHAT domain-containing protein